MFKIESYVTPILLSYVDKYVRDFKPEDAQVSLWGGGVGLHNLVLKPDVLEREVSLPFTLVSGRIHELLIQVPWTKIMSEPIVVTIDTIECVLSLNPPLTTSEDGSPPEPASPKPQMEAPPGYMQALVRRIVSNISVRVHHLIVKYVQDDIVLSLNVKYLSVDSADANWDPSFADIDQAEPVLRRLVKLDDLTLCLDSADADGKIRFFQEPLLYRCQLDLRVLTRLVSANTRRASSLSVQVRSERLAWSVTGDQLTMLLRLYGENGFQRPTTPQPRTSSNLTVQIMHSSSSAEPTRTPSWSDWAWSWLPQWTDREVTDDSPATPTPLPVHFDAYLDEISVVFKAMELESLTRRRARAVLQLVALHTAFRGYVCKPVAQRMHFGVRELTLTSCGRCVCGSMDYRSEKNEPIVYFERQESRGGWSWPDLQMEDPDRTAREMHDIPKSDLSGSSEPQQSDHGQPEEPKSQDPEKERSDESEFWKNMSPLVLVHFKHERTPPLPGTNPYEGPPVDFQYSDWVEECIVKIVLEPVNVELCMGLFHRLNAIRAIYRELPLIPQPELPMRTLTVEEAEALSENLPERRVAVEAQGMRIRVVPWDHTGDRARPSLVFLDLQVASGGVVLNGPLYPHRVCSAACQIPESDGPLWQAARLHTTVTLSFVQAHLAASSGAQAKPCARFDLRAVAHTLLNPHYFVQQESINYGLSLKICEANICGSTARLLAAWEVATSIVNQRLSYPLRYTTLPTDAFNDDEAVAIDLSIEDLILRSFITHNTNTFIVTMQSAKATALHEPKDEELKQAWFFSAPDAPISSPYLRLALQWCNEKLNYSLDYLGIWTEPTAICVDPLFIAWLAYKPVVIRGHSFINVNKSSSTQSAMSFMKHRTPPSSSGRGGSKNSAELAVHVRPRSISSSEKAATPETKHHKQAGEVWWHGSRLLELHERLRRMLINVELGLTLVYVTMTSASALDCGTIRDTMERHASNMQRVLAISLGRISMYSSSLTKHFWQDIKHDGPTFVSVEVDNDLPESFPWRLRLADVSCYTLEVRSPERTKIDKATMRSKLKTPLVATPRTVLELCTTTVTLSVVTKSLQFVSAPKFEKTPRPQQDVKAQRTKYFTSGMDFKPSTLKEFVRGPANRKKEKEVQEPAPAPPTEPRGTTSAGPVVSLGVHLHADTPPLIVRVEQDQVHLVADTVHCFRHIISLLKRPSMYATKRSLTALATQRPSVRSTSEEFGPDRQMPSDDEVLSDSDNPSELIPLFVADERTAAEVHGLKTFFYFQWVISRVAVVGATDRTKLAFDIDDIIATADLQAHYNQLKVKVASASVRHYEKTHSTDWTAGDLHGRVLEVREPVDSKADNHFLLITVTQAQISKLPTSWKEELHPKLLKQKSFSDSMWEIFATLAPLEIVLQPEVLKQIISLVREMAPRSFCPLHKEVDQKINSWQWPFFYVNAGGLRLLLTQERLSEDTDDTLIFEVGAVYVTPHPVNPICRRSTTAVNEGGWASTGGGSDGRQYEIQVRNVSVQTTQFRQLIVQEASQADQLKSGRSSENPALKWAPPIPAPDITTLLHSVDISSVLAPALFVGDMLACGTALELNLVSDCAIELSLDQVVLLGQSVCDIYAALKESEEECYAMQFDAEKYGVCPYAALIETRDSVFIGSETLVAEELGRGNDSGVDSAAATSRFRPFDDSHSTNFKKSQSRVAFAERSGDASEHLEVFVTVGVIQISLYVIEDGSPEVAALRPPHFWDKAKCSHSLPEPDIQSVPESRERQKSTYGSASGSRQSITDLREQHATTKLAAMRTQARRQDGALPLVHVMLSQPNLYYWRRRSQNTLQVSLFNAWMGLGAGAPDLWTAPLLTTAQGTSDPLTDIRPALATLRIVAPCLGSNTGTAATRGSVTVDIERPVLFEVCVDRLQRLQDICNLLKKKTSLINPHESEEPGVEPETRHPLYRLRKLLAGQAVETLTLTSSQIAVSGAEGVVGWDAATLQIGAGARPHRLTARALLAAATVSVGAPGDLRHVLLQPLMVGLELDASWEAWRHAEGGLARHVPSVRVGVDLDRVALGLRPGDLAAAARLLRAAELLRREESFSTPSSAQSLPSAGPEKRPSTTDSRESTSDDHYYKDDLRSGAFKIVTGGQLPMAYQVTLHDNAVAWRYPHPRAITRLVAFPLPGQETETPCILELYNQLLNQWEQHSHFSIPVNEPVETQLYATPPDAVFALMWRYRVYEKEEASPMFVFDGSRFTPRPDPLSNEPSPDLPPPKSTKDVTTEQLSGVVRVDSCFAPRATPGLLLAARLAALVLYVHNDQPPATSHKTPLEGYYVSKPLMRSHRVLTMRARSATLHANLASSPGALVVLQTYFSSDILDCSTGTMERMVNEFRLQGGVSYPRGGKPRARLASSHVVAVLHVPRLRTLHALSRDWQAAVEQYLHKSKYDEPPPATTCTEPEVTASALEGRVSLWIHNTTASALRVGQEGTDEVVPLGPGSRLAYRWRCPTSAKNLRFSLAGPIADWHWSNSIPFTVGCERVRLVDAEPATQCWLPGAGVFLHTSVVNLGARRELTLAGRLRAANLLRDNLHYKVRTREADGQWRTIASGEIAAESLGHSVLCAADADMIFKIKFVDQDVGWSGDIPLKQCPKENVPWLVKVPSEGETPFTCVWCRVVRARSDSRLLVAVWPLYVLHSHLPLDTDVLITTSVMSTTQPAPETAPRKQSTPGRGASSHLLAPGTTAARHLLSFQYTGRSCPVTAETIPLHYGVTDTSVFDKRAPVATIEEVLAEITVWLERSATDAVSPWPYSVVAGHWPGHWKPALLQPRSDVTVRYQAIRAGGGCSLEIQLCPVVLLCNASPIALTLRSHDAAPLCKLEPGTVISPPSTILKKPFFLSVEIGRETYVSGELAVTGVELGCYGAPAEGLLALEHAADLAVLCDHKVALLTMYYELKEEINVLGITSTYMLINRMKTKILVSALAVPGNTSEPKPLLPTIFKVVNPTPEGSTHGTPLCKFVLMGRWRGGSPDDLNLYLYVTTNGAERGSAPVRVGQPPLRRALCYINARGRSVPVVVTQVKTEGRWVLTVAEDPCPELLVQNMTKTTLCLAQPVAQSLDEPSTSAIEVRPECPGVRWVCTVPPGAATHYSTPAHCARYPPPQSTAPATQVGSVSFITLAMFKEEGPPDWCGPVGVAEGSQLVQLGGGTVKLRVRAHPHSTLLELRDVDQHDISASDIRNRLFGAFSTEEAAGYADRLSILERSEAAENLISRTEMSMDYNIAGPSHAMDQDIYSHDSVSASLVPKNTLQLLPTAGRASITLTASDASERSGHFAPGLPSEDSLADDLKASTQELLADGGGSVELPSQTSWSSYDVIRLVVAGLSLELSAAADARPLVALHLDRAALLVRNDARRTKTTLSIANVQIDNLQYESGQFDFAVIASTRSDVTSERWPPLWNPFGAREPYASQAEKARILLLLTHDTWTVHGLKYTELTEVEVRVGPLALYIEDAYVSAVAALARAAAPPCAPGPLAEERALRAPLRLRTLLVHPLELTLTLHTAVRMYIALDHSPLRLSAFGLRDVMTSTERLTHALTVHYLSAAILGAGWVVGGLELLGAPGALAARVGGARGGVRGVASTAAAALLRSLSAWAGSLARNLDLLAGDEEHARRAAAARRRPPPSFVAGLSAGITNFAINILGAVGGLAHHPLVSVAVGETESSATALRRGLVGAFTKPLSATADLVAFAGHGLLTQTGWDPSPQARRASSGDQTRGWGRDCVRWLFRLAELEPLDGYRVLLDSVPLHLILTHKFLVVTDPESQRIVEMIDYKFCTIHPYQGQILELIVTQKRQCKVVETRADQDDEFEISAAAMARVARYTGAGAGAGAGAREAGEVRVLSLLPTPGAATSLHALLLALVHHNAPTHLSLL